MGALLLTKVHTLFRFLQFLHNVLSVPASPSGHHKHLVTMSPQGLLVMTVSQTSLVLYDFDSCEQYWTVIL